MALSLMECPPTVKFKKMKDILHYKLSPLSKAREELEISIGIAGKWRDVKCPSVTSISWGQEIISNNVEVRVVNEHMAPDLKCPYRESQCPDVTQIMLSISHPFQAKRGESLEFSLRIAGKQRDITCPSVTSFSSGARGLKFGRNNHHIGGSKFTSQIFDSLFYLLYNLYWCLRLHLRSIQEWGMVVLGQVRLG